MNLRNYRSLGLLWMMLGLATLACGLSGGDNSNIPNNAVVVEVVANSSLMPWLNTAVSTFNATETPTSDGDPVYVVLQGTEAGQAVTELAGGLVATLWIPDEQVWVNVLADQGNNNFQSDCVSVAQSPLVIGMWRPIAESLGWPGLPLGWLDVGSLAADPSTWKYYSGGEFGDALHLGHTHPGLSGSGASTLLAIVQAAQAKSQAVTAEEIRQPIVQASVGAFEGAVTWFSNNTNTLGQTMKERGTTYLGAAVMYESTVVQYGGGEIVPIYPLEGTFMATHPACINQTAVSEAQEAARLFRDYLLSEAGQQAALASGLRPVNTAVSIAAPLDASRGVDPDQPQIIFNAPSVETIYAVQEVWQEARKDVNLVMLLDTSGSMRGNKIDGMKAAAEQFVQQMGDDDYLTLVGFSTVPTLLIDHEQVGPNRDRIINTIRNLEAQGDTSLFDAIGQGATYVSNTTSPNTTNAMVVLSDGLDTSSIFHTFGDSLINAATANNTTIFTIAYGDDADENVLSNLALRGNGNYFQGDEASIAAIYEEMSAAFGGSVGVGR